MQDPASPVGRCAPPVQAGLTYRPQPSAVRFTDLRPKRHAQSSRTYASIMVSHAPAAENAAVPRLITTNTNRSALSKRRTDLSTISRWNKVVDAAVYVIWADHHRYRSAVFRFASVRSAGTAIPVGRIIQ